MKKTIIKFTMFHTIELPRPMEVEDSRANYTNVYGFTELSPSNLGFKKPNIRNHNLKG